MQRTTNLIERTGTRTASRLRVLPGGDEAPFEVVLPGAGVVVGADPACDVVVRDAAVSRKHLSVVPAESGFTVVDSSSRNGTWLDGAQVSRATVPMGTTLRIGNTALQLLPAEETIEIPPSQADHFGALLGTSQAMRRVYALLERASAADVPLLVLGESGTGKELVARAVHDAGKRARAPFVVFDCGAASDTLIESELFGHKRGAFTGAHADRPGAFALAHGGTLFLDEIGDLPLPLQPKLLRLLERGEVTPLGARKSERYDVRIVAATHRDVWGEVGRGTFRADVYYRLAVVEAHLPALRHRIDDVPTLVRAFLRAAGASDAAVEGPALQRMLAYSWPGNVPCLRNVVARAVALGRPGATFAEMPVVLRAGVGEAPERREPLGRADVPYHEAKEALLARFDREYMTDLMTRSGQNISRAARTAGIERKHLYKILERAGLREKTAAGGNDDDDDDA